MAVEHRDTRFDSHGEQCGAELFLPEGPGPHPAVILCHGLGATREMGMEPYARAFAEAGIVALTFTYRCFGDSDGEPRQLLDIPMQRQDIAAAIAYAKKLPQVDAERIALFGSSFGGGHVIVVGSQRDDIKAVIAQCPFTDGLASGMTLGPVSTVKVTALALADRLASFVNQGPVYARLVAPRGEAAMMTTPDANSGYLALIPEDFDVDLRVAARLGMEIIYQRPGRALKSIACPTLVCACENDTVAPYGPTAKMARSGGPNVELKSYPFGHFDIYVGEGFERTSADQVEFLVRTLKP
jgi:dienelactone hydrolase